MTDRPDDTTAAAPDEATTPEGPGVADEATSAPGAAEAQEVPPAEAIDEPVPSEPAVSDPSPAEGDTVSGEVIDEVSTAEVDTDDVNTDEVNTEAVNDPTGGDAPGAEHPDTLVARERLADLQRLQAEYVNYKRRVDRDRALVQERVIADVLDSLLPVLDDIHAAREHGDLAGGPFASIADKLENSLGKFGLERYGTPGEAFDPVIHEALLHAEWDGSITPVDASATTIVQVLQPGYRTGQRVIRPARVSVADPS